MNDKDQEKGEDEPILLATGELEVVRAAEDSLKLDESLELAEIDEDLANEAADVFEEPELEAEELPADEVIEQSEPPTLLEEELLEEDLEAPEPEAPQGDQAEWTFFSSEARALADRQPERAALMWIEAAAAAERANLGIDRVHQDLDRALALRPDATWLIRRSRRMMMRLGSFERALKLGQMEIKLGGEPGNGAAVLVEGAALVRYRLHKPAPALKLVEQALQLRSRYVPALVWAASLRNALQQQAPAAEALEQLGESLTDPGQRALCLYSAGTLRETKLEDLEGAQVAYARAAEADPRNVPVQLALADLYGASEQWQPLCRSLEHLADLLQEPTDKARLLLMAGSLHLDRTGNLDAASRALSRAVRAVPDNAAALQRLVYTYEGKGAPREMVQSLRQLLALTPDRQSRAALLCQVAMLHTGLHEVDEAISAYREALEQMEGYLPALQALGSLYRQRADYESLVAISEPQTEGTLPAPARAVRYVELAEILAEHLERPEDAVAAYNRAMDLSPELRLAYWGQATLLRGLGWHEEAAELLARQVQVSEDSRTRTHLQIERSRLQGEQLGSPETAIETLLQISAEEENGACSRAFDLIDLYRRTERFADLVALLLAEAGRTKDPHEAEGRRIQAAQVLEFKLEEYDRALKLYREVLETNPTSHAAIHGAGRILHRTAAWSELIKLHHHELVQQPDRPDASIILCRVGRVLTEKLGNRGAAIKAYSKALRQDPSCTPALVALDGLVRSEKRWPDLVEVLRQYAAAHTDDQAAALALCRAGEVACWQLGQLEQSAELFEAALAHQPKEEIALYGLLQVRLRQGRWSAAVECIELLLDLSPTAEQRAALQLQQARLKEFRLNQEPDLALYQQTTDGPFADRLREELLRVWRLVRPEAPEMVEHLAKLGRDTVDDALAAAYLLEASYLREFGDGVDIAGGKGDNIAIIQEAYRRKPEDLAIIWSLERALQHQQRWQDLAEICEREAQLELDRSMRVQRLASAAEAYHRAGDTEKATRVCRECLNFDAHCLPALRLLQHVAASQENWRQLAELCDRLAEACTDIENRLTSCLQAAQIWTDNVQDIPRALASLAVALADDPGQEQAFNRAAELLRQREDFDELSRLYQRRIRVCRDDEVRVELLRQHAQLLGEDLKRPDRAITELNTVLEIVNDDMAALGSLAQLHGQLGHWSDAAQALGQLIERARDDEVRHTARLQQAELWIQRLHDPKRGREVLEQAAAEKPDDIAVKQMMITLAMNGGDWQQARTRLEELANAPETRTWALLRLVEVAQLGLRDDTLAESYIKDAVRQAASDEAALTALREHYPTPEEKLRLASLAEQLVGDERLAASEVIGALELLARLLLEDLNKPERAVPHLQELQRRKPGRDSSMLLGRALEMQGNNGEALVLYAQIVEEDASALEAFRGLVRTADDERAASAAAIVELLGEAGPEEAVQLKTLQVDRPPRGHFSVEDFVFGDDELQLGDVMETLTPYLVQHFGRPFGEQLGGDHPAATCTRQLAASVGLDEVVVEVGGAGAVVAIGDPIRVCIGENLVPESASPVFRFWVGRALIGAVGGGVVTQSLDNEALYDLFEAIYAKRPSSEQGQRLKKALGRQLPRKVRKQLEAYQTPDYSASSWLALRKASQERADRMAIILSRHPRVALTELAAAENIHDLKSLARTPRFAGLIRFCISTDFARLCRKVWS